MPIQYQKFVTKILIFPNSSLSPFSVDGGASAGGLCDPAARAARPEGGAAVQLRPGGRQPLLGQVVLQPEGVLPLHPLGQPQGHHLQPPPRGQRQCESQTLSDTFLALVLGNVDIRYGDSLSI